MFEMNLKIKKTMKVFRNGIYEKEFKYCIYSNKPLSNKIKFSTHFFQTSFKDKMKY